MKLDFKNDFSIIFNEMSRLLGLAPVVMLMAATLMVIVTLFSVRDFMSKERQKAQLTELPKFEVKVNPVNAKVYENYAEVLSRLSPKVSVTASLKGLKIEIAQAVDYPEFMYVLNSVQGLSQDVVWTAEEICLAGCQGAASMALIKGVRETVAVKLRG